MLLLFVLFNLDVNFVQCIDTERTDGRTSVPERSQSPTEAEILNMKQLGPALCHFPRKRLKSFIHDLSIFIL